MSEETGRPRRVTCQHCEDVIGVYEVAVLETGSGPLETSLTIDPWLSESSDPCYHRACYQARDRESG